MVNNFRKTVWKKESVSHEVARETRESRLNGKADPSIKVRNYAPQPCTRPVFYR